jgi:predicted hotdog family 3-hydroxylacyl-ACP dehydratase
MTLPMDRTQIATLIPHAGAMCLLDAVIAWDATTIACLASSHRTPTNPLAARGRLEVVCGVEYAAQAMAVHGALASGGRRPTAGYLASLRDVTCSVERLDTLESELRVAAELLIADAGRVIYRFNLTCYARPVLSGQAAVVLDMGPSQ